MRKITTDRTYFENHVRRYSPESCEECPLRPEIVGGSGECDEINDAYIQLKNLALENRSTGRFFSESTVTIRGASVYTEQVLINPPLHGRIGNIANESATRYEDESERLKTKYGTDISPDFSMLPICSRSLGEAALGGSVLANEVPLG
jgi:hypothetical protein